MAKVFIGIPTRSRPVLVQETVKSALSQTFQDFKIVVSDNQSEDSAARTVEEFIHGLRDDRVAFYRQAENVGEYGQGRFFFKSSGDCPYFMILHDDDVLKPDYLAKGTAVLEQHPAAALFVANPFTMNLQGRPSLEEKARYLRQHGRIGQETGLFDVLSQHMACGFTPISGTLFRRSALDKAGFVDEDCHGNYPFENNIFLRLGEQHATGWFTSEELLGFRFHPRSLRNSRLMDDRLVVETMIRLYARRRFSGASEHQRKTTLGRLYRAKALILLRDGKLAEARRYLVQSLRENAFSVKTWMVVPLLLLLPGCLRRMMPGLPEPWEPPGVSAPKQCDSG